MCKYLSHAIASYLARFVKLPELLKLCNAVVNKHGIFSDTFCVSLFGHSAAHTVCTEGQEQKNMSHKLCVDILSCFPPSTHYIKTYNGC